MKTNLRTIAFNSFWDLKNNHLSAFFAYWSKNHGLNPDAFPSFMSEGDWEEQFNIFVDSVYDVSVKENGFYKAL